MKLNSIYLPITFDSSALLSITDSEIKTQVQNLEGDTSNISTSVNNISLNIKSDLYESGIDIDNKTITLNSNTIAINDTLFEDGYINANIINADDINTENLIATKLNSVSDNNSNIHIEDGVIEIMNNDTLYLAFGIDENGMAIINFYKNGICKYKLCSEGFVNVS